MYQTFIKNSLLNKDYENLIKYDILTKRLSNKNIFFNKYLLKNNNKLLEQYGGVFPEDPTIVLVKSNGENTSYTVRKFKPDNKVEFVIKDMPPLTVINNVFLNFLNKHPTANKLYDLLYDAYFIATNKIDRYGPPNIIMEGLYFKIQDFLRNKEYVINTHRKKNKTWVLFKSKLSIFVDNCKTINEYNTYLNNLVILFIDNKVKDQGELIEIIKKYLLDKYNTFSTRFKNEEKKTLRVRQKSKIFTRSGHYLRQNKTNPNKVGFPNISDEILRMISERMKKPSNNTLKRSKEQARTNLSRPIS